MGEDTDSFNEDHTGESENETADSFIWESIPGTREAVGKEDADNFESEPQRPKPESAPWEDSLETEHGDVPSEVTDEPTLTEGEKNRLWESSEKENEDSIPPEAKSDKDRTPAKDTSETDTRMWAEAQPEPQERPQQTPEKPADDEFAQGDETGTDQSRESSSFDHLLENRSISNRTGGDTDTPPSDGTGTTGLFDELGEFDRTSSGSQVLVLSPLNHSVTQEVFEDFLRAGSASVRNVMLVSTRDRNESVLSPLFREVSVNKNGNLTVIELGDVSMSDLEADEAEGIDVSSVSNPKNLSKCGLVVMQTLRNWEQNDFPTTFSFHSLSDIQGFVDEEVLFQFLFTLQRKLTSTGVSGLFHMDPRKQDQQSLNTLKELFDITVSVSRDKTVEIQ